MDKTEHQGEKGTEADEVGRAGEVRFDAAKQTKLARRIWAAQRTKRAPWERQGQRPSTSSPAPLDTEVVPVSALSFFGCLLVAVVFCEILSGYTGFLPKFSDHFLYARDV